MKIAVFVSVEREDGCITTYSSTNYISSINEIELIDYLIGKTITENRKKKDWIGGKVEKIIVTDIDYPHFSLVEEKNYPTRFNHLLEY